MQKQSIKIPDVKYSGKQVERAVAVEILRNAIYALLKTGEK